MATYTIEELKELRTRMFTRGILYTQLKSINRAFHSLTKRNQTIAQFHEYAGWFLLRNIHLLLFEGSYKIQKESVEQRLIALDHEIVLDELNSAVMMRKTTIAENESVELEATIRRYRELLLAEHYNMEFSNEQYTLIGVSNA